jgi:Plasmid pRiA4b ORF-3-like protein
MFQLRITKHDRIMPTKSTKIYQLKIVLQGSKPPIWRRIQVKSNITLDVLHEIIQTAMGWYNSHLHQFDVHGTFYSSPAFHLEETEDESRIKLDRVLTRPQQKFSYEYDFGDGWDHQIVLEKILPVEPETKYPYIFWQYFRIKIIQNMPSHWNNWNGLVVILTQRSSIWQKLTKGWQISLEKFDAKVLLTLI